MKTTKELNIGDYVLDSPKGFPMFVQSIYGDDTVYLDFNENNGDTWETDIKDVTPIPITTEIILKNGFKKFKGYHEYNNYRLETDTHVIHIEKVDKDPEYDLYAFRKGEQCPYHHQTQVTYVHELQNAIRMMTKNDIPFEI